MIGPAHPEPAGSLSLALVPARPEERTRLIGMFGLVSAWLLYTRFFVPLQAAHATLPPCPFLFITGHPCPLCGGTRSFSWMWRGDATSAAALYPLGPLLFWGALLSLPLLAAGLITNRMPAVAASTRLRRAALAGALAVIGASWLLKLTVLPN